MMIAMIRQDNEPWLRNNQAVLFFRELLLFLPEVLAFGTLAPACLASDKPIAIACLRLVTFFPLRPLFNVPCFLSCMAFSTFSPAFFEYFAIVNLFTTVPNSLWV